MTKWPGNLVNLKIQLQSLTNKEQQKEHGLSIKENVSMVIATSVSY